MADSVYVAGNFNGWQPGNHKYRFGHSGKLALTAQAGNILEFKCTLGGWHSVEVSATGSDIPNRLVIVNADTVIHISVAGWRHQLAAAPRRSTASLNVVILDSSITIKGLNRTRKIRLYLPPGYAATNKRYPVLYMLDGQNLFDVLTSGYGEWKVDEALDSLYKATGQGIIVVGIDHGAEHRLTEYNPYDHERFGKGEGQQFAAFVCQQLKPMIDSQYRTLSAPANTWMAGSSMGGVISFYSAITYPEYIGGAGVFSPAFWTAPALFEAAKSYYHSAPKGYLYCYAGGSESETMEPETRKMFGLVNLSSDGKKQLQIDETGRHNETAWAHWFHQFLQFMLANLPQADAGSGR